VKGPWNRRRYTTSSLRGLTSHHCWRGKRRELWM